MDDRADMSDDLIDRLRDPGAEILSASENMRTRRQAADRIEELEAEMERLREALEYYAWADHYEGDNYLQPVVMDDRGQRARAALKQEKDDG